MKLLGRGAEARIFASAYLGRKCVVKVRDAKAYREKSLDGKITRERLRAECGLLARAKKAGVRTPVVWKVDLKGGAITTEHVEGRTLKEELLRGAPSKEAGRLCAEMGGEIAKLHSSGIVHGDLTTGNIIMHKGGLVFLDFGMGEVSRKLEAKAVDLLALKKTFAATHFNIMEKWGEVEKGYLEGFAGGKAVLGQMRAVEARARYY